MHKYLSKSTVWRSQTFAVRGPIVDPPRRTVTACSATRRVHTLALAVATTVLGQALVYV